MQWRPRRNLGLLSRTWRMLKQEKGKKMLEQVELQTQKRYGPTSTSEQLIQAWEPNETESKASIVKLSADQAQVMQDNVFLKSS